jgi:hypothetical protein
MPSKWSTSNPDGWSARRPGFGAVFAKVRSPRVHEIRKHRVARPRASLGSRSVSSKGSSDGFRFPARSRSQGRSRKGRRATRGGLDDGEHRTALDCRRPNIRVKVLESAALKSMRSPFFIGPKRAPFSQALGGPKKSPGVTWFEHRVWVDKSLSFDGLPLVRRLTGLHLVPQRTRSQRLAGQAARRESWTVSCSSVRRERHRASLAAGLFSQTRAAQPLNMGCDREGEAVSSRIRSMICGKLFSVITAQLAR